MFQDIGKNQRKTGKLEHIGIQRPYENEEGIFDSLHPSIIAFLRMSQVHGSILSTSRASHSFDAIL